MDENRIIEILKEHSDYIQSDRYIHQGDFKAIAKAILAELPTDDEINEQLQFVDNVYPLDKIKFRNGVTWCKRFKRKPKKPKL